MTIEIKKAELAQLVQEELVNEHFQNVDDLLIKAIYAGVKNTPIPNHFNALARTLRNSYSNPRLQGLI